MAEIKRITTDGIKALYQDVCNESISRLGCYDYILELILAWVEERWQKNVSDFMLAHGDCCHDDCMKIDKRKHRFGLTDWRNEVLDEIGWPKDQR